MSPEHLAIAQWAWLVVGVGLIVAEFFVPGIILVFFGAGAVLTSLFVALGAFQTLGAQLLFWAGSSLLLLILLRNQVRRWFPSLEVYEPYDEQADIEGRIVDVLEEIVPGTDEGRVRLQGTTWKASAGNRIPAGKKVRIVRRDNLILEVEEIDH